MFGGVSITDSRTRSPCARSGPTAKDAAPVFSVVIFAVVIPLYASGFAISSPQSPIVQLLAYFPYTAPITALILNAFGSLPLWQAIVIIVELFLLSVVVLRIAVRLFRSWRDLEIPRVLTHREAADLLEVQRGFTSFSTLYPSGQVPLSSVAVLASKRKA